MWTRTVRRRGKRSTKQTRKGRLDEVPVKQIRGEFESHSGYRIFEVRNLNSLVKRQDKPAGQAERQQAYP